MNGASVQDFGKSELVEFAFLLSLLLLRFPKNEDAIDFHGTFGGKKQNS